MTPDRLDRKGDESSAVVRVGNPNGEMFQEPQGFNQEIKHKTTKSGSKRAVVLYLRRSWQPQRCSSGPQRRTGRASTSECPRLQLSSSSTCTLSLPWGNHLNSKYKVKKKKNEGKNRKKSCMVQKIAPLCKDSSASLLGSISRLTPPKKFCAIEKKFNLKLKNQAASTIWQIVSFYLSKPKLLVRLLAWGDMLWTSLEWV